MIQPGLFAQLKINRFTPQGAYLSDSIDEVLLPDRYLTPDMDRNQELNVFIYHDAEERLTATTVSPKITLNTFAFLKVNGTTRFGAFMDWGLPKDLLVPNKEQSEPMQLGQSYVVYLKTDLQTGRLIGSSKIYKHAQNDDLEIDEGESVECLVFRETDLGFEAIINHKHIGLIYRNEVFRPVKIGDKLSGLIKKIRADQRIDISLSLRGIDEAQKNAEQILKLIDQNQGFLALTDKSSPDEIKRIFEMSKKNFKKACGYLYKNKLILIEPQGLRKV